MPSIKFLLLTAILLAPLLLAGCNTVHGMGQDIGNAGTGISNTAQKVQQKM
jgi:predicted small secreted protein